MIDVVVVVVTNFCSPGKNAFTCSGICYWLVDVTWWVTILLLWFSISSPTLSVVSLSLAGNDPLISVVVDVTIVFLTIFFYLSASTILFFFSSISSSFLCFSSARRYFLASAASILRYFSSKILFFLVSASRSFFFCAFFAALTFLGFFFSHSILLYSARHSSNCFHANLDLRFRSDSLWRFFLNSMMF